MKRTSAKLMILGTMTSLGLGLFLAGCGQNQARETAEIDAPPAVEQPVEPDATIEQREKEAELSARAREVARKEADLDRRMHELEQRIETFEQRSEPAPPPVEAPEEAVTTALPAVTKTAPEPPRTVWITLPAAMPFEVEITEDLSSETSLIGDPVTAVVTRDLVREGRVVVPAGSRLFGTVTDVVAQKKIGGQARLSLDFDRLRTTAGQEVAIRAFLDTEGRSQKKKDAATIGGSVAGGALLGRILSDGHKDRGTVLGAVLGAAVGTAVASNNRADEVVIEAGTIAELRFDAPVELAVNDGEDPGPYARTR